MKGRDKSEPLTRYERFESEYHIGDVVSVRDPETGRKRPGTFTLKGQFQTGPYEGWWANNKTGSGQSYREENKPVLDVDIIEWLDFNRKVVQPSVLEVTWS